MTKIIYLDLENVQPMRSTECRHIRIMINYLYFWREMYPCDCPLSVMSFLLASVPRQSIVFACAYMTPLHLYRWFWTLLVLFFLVMEISLLMNVTPQARNLIQFRLHRRHIMRTGHVWNKGGGSYDTAEFRTQNLLFINHCIHFNVYTIIFP